MPSVTSSPRISVIIPTRNRRSLLARAVASVMAQEEQDFELIVVNDGSTDDTAAYLVSLTDPRLRMISNPRNLGVAKVRNIALEASRGDVVAMLDDDDVYLPGRLSVPLTIFAQHPDVVGAMSSAVRLRRSGNDPANPHVLRVPDTKLAPEAFEWALFCFLVGSEGSGITFRREDAIAIGGFDERLIWHEDREFLIRLGRRGGCYLIGEALWQKNFSDDGLTTQWTKAGPALVNLCSVRPEYLTRYRKLASYLATQILVGDIRKGLLGALWRDLASFKTAGLIDGNILRMWRDHRDVRSYRRRMLKPEALAELVGPPDSWNESRA